MHDGRNRIAGAAIEAIIATIIGAATGAAPGNNVKVTKFLAACGFFV
jgi:uncharacterized protein YcfJ